MDLLPGAPFYIHNVHMLEKAVFLPMHTIVEFVANAPRGISHARRDVLDTTGVFGHTPTMNKHGEQKSHCQKIREVSDAPVPKISTISSAMCIANHWKTGQVESIQIVSNYSTRNKTNGAASCKSKLDYILYQDRFVAALSNFQHMWDGHLGLIKAAGHLIDQV